MGGEMSALVKTAVDERIAEKDPCNDLNGNDAAAKLAILASLAFNTLISPDQIYTEGIASALMVGEGKDKELKITETINYQDDFIMGRLTENTRKCHVIKPLAIAEKKNGKLELRVHPAYIAEGI